MHKQNPKPFIMIFQMTIFLVLISWLSQAAAASASQEFSREFSITTPLTLDVETSSGDISVKPSEDGQLRIRGEIKVNALSAREARRIADDLAENPPIKIQASTVTVGKQGGYNLWLNPFRTIAISYVIEVPYETRVAMDTSSGDQFLQNLQGPVRSSVSSGNVSIQGVALEVAVDVSSGTVNLSDIAANVSLEVSSGSARLTDIKANLEADISSGDVDVNSAIAEDARWTFDSSSGDVLLGLPAGARFQLRAEVSSGQIALHDFAFSGSVADRDVDVSTSEDASAMIIINTSSGDVQIGQQ